MNPNGIRIGTPAVTTRGMKEANVEQVADWIVDALEHSEDTTYLAELHQKVMAFNRQFPLPKT